MYRYQMAVVLVITLMFLCRLLLEYKEIHAVCSRDIYFKNRRLIHYYIQMRVNIRARKNICLCLLKIFSFGLCFIFPILIVQDVVDGFVCIVLNRRILQVDEMQFPLISDRATEVRK
jgi:hypothetical protein